MATSPERRSGSDRKLDCKFYIGEAQPKPKELLIMTYYNLS